MVAITRSAECWWWKDTWHRFPPVLSHVCTSPGGGGGRSQGATGCALPGHLQSPSKDDLCGGQLFADAEEPQFAVQHDTQLVRGGGRGRGRLQIKIGGWVVVGRCSVLRFFFIELLNKKRAYDYDMKMMINNHGEWIMYATLSAAFFYFFYANSHYARVRTYVCMRSDVGSRGLIYIVTLYVVALVHRCNVADFRFFCDHLLTKWNDYTYSSEWGWVREDLNVKAHITVHAPGD